MRHSTIFKSRWMALAWSAGIVWFAVDVASGNRSDDVAVNVTDNVSDMRGDAALNETRTLVEQLNPR